MSQKTNPTVPTTSNQSGTRRSPPKKEKAKGQIGQTTTEPMNRKTDEKQTVNPTSNQTSGNENQRHGANKTRTINSSNSSEVKTTTTKIDKTDHNQTKLLKNVEDGNRRTKSTSEDSKNKLQSEELRKLVEEIISERHQQQLEQMKLGDELKMLEMESKITKLASNEISRLEAKLEAVSNNKTIEEDVNILTGDFHDFKTSVNSRLEQFDNLFRDKRNSEMLIEVEMKEKMKNVETHQEIANQQFELFENQFQQLRADYERKLTEVNNLESGLWSAEQKSIDSSITDIYKELTLIKDNVGLGRIENDETGIIIGNDETRQELPEEMKNRLIVMEDKLQKCSSTFTELKSKLDILERNQTGNWTEIAELRVAENRQEKRCSDSVDELRKDLERLEKEVDQSGHLETLIEKCREEILKKTKSYLHQTIKAELNDVTPRFNKLEELTSDMKKNQTLQSENQTNQIGKVDEKLSMIQKEFDNFKNSNIPESTKKQLIEETKEIAQELIVAGLQQQNLNQIDSNIINLKDDQNEMNEIITRLQDNDSKMEKQLKSFDRVSKTYENMQDEIELMKNAHMEELKWKDKLEEFIEELSRLQDNDSKMEKQLKSFDRVSKTYESMQDEIESMKNTQMEELKWKNKLKDIEELSQKNNVQVINFNSQIQNLQENQDQTAKTTKHLQDNNSVMKLQLSKIYETSKQNFDRLKTVEIPELIAAKLKNVFKKCKCETPGYISASEKITNDKLKQQATEINKIQTKVNTLQTLNKQNGEFVQKNGKAIENLQNEYTKFTNVGIPQVWLDRLDNLSTDIISRLCHTGSGKDIPTVLKNEFLRNQAQILGVQSKVKFVADTQIKNIQNKLNSIEDKLASSFENKTHLEDIKTKCFEHLISKLAEMKTEISESSMQFLRTELLAQNAKDSMDSDMDEIHQKNKEKLIQDQLDRITRQITDFRDKDNLRETVQNKIKPIVKNVDNLNGDFKNLKEQLTKITELMEESNSKSGISKIESADEIQDLNQQLHQLKSDFDQLRDNVRESVQEKDKTIQDQLNKSVNTLNKLEQQISKIASESSKRFHDFNSNFSTVEIHMNNIDGKLAELETKHHTINEKLSAKDENKLTEDLGNLRTENSEMKLKMDQLQTTTDATEVNNSEFKNKFDRLMEDLSKCPSDLKQLSRRTDHFSTELEAIKKTNASISDYQINIEKDKGVLVNHFDKLNHAMNTNETKVDLIEKSIVEIATRINTLEHGFLSLKSDSDAFDSKMQLMVNANSVIDTRMEALHHQQNGNNFKLNKLESTWTEMTNNLTKEIQLVESKLNVLEEETKNETRAINSLETDREMMTARINEMKDGFNSMLNSMRSDISGHLATLEIYKRADVEKAELIDLAMLKIKTNYESIVLDQRNADLKLSTLQEKLESQLSNIDNRMLAAVDCLRNTYKGYSDDRGAVEDFDGGATSKQVDQTKDPPSTPVMGISSEEEIVGLPVATIRKLLSQHSVNYDGCFEKPDLVSKLAQLWRDLNKNSGDVPEADRCLICMDARIDCVFLECGHMATCNECGRQVKDCPVCRMYVTRVVRTYRP